jgi:hypothetical protein
MVRETIRRSCRRPATGCPQETPAGRRPRSRRRAGATPATLAAGLACLAGSLSLTPPPAWAAARAQAAAASAGATQAQAAAAAPTAPADPVIAEVLRMLRGGVAPPVVALWLDKSGKRPAAVGSGDLVALHQAGASDDLLKRLIQLAGGTVAGAATRSPAAAGAAAPSAAAQAPPAAAATPAPSSAAAAPPAAAATPAPSPPAAAPPPPAAPSPAVAVAPAAPVQPAAAVAAAGTMVKTRYAVTYRPVSVGDESQMSEPWWLLLYVDGRFVAAVKPGPVLLPLPPRTFDHELAPGRHLLRITQERHRRPGAGRGYISSSRVDPSEFPFELAPGGAAQIAVHFGEKSFRHPGPIAIRVEQEGREIARLEPAGPDPEGWPPVCEDVPAALPAGAKLPSAARQDLARCVHWAALWPGIAALPSRDEVRADVERLAAADRRMP